MSEQKDTKKKFGKDVILKESLRTYQATTSPVPEIVKPKNPKQPPKE